MANEFYQPAIAGQMPQQAYYNNTVINPWERNFNNSFAQNSRFTMPQMPLNQQIMQGTPPTYIKCRAVTSFDEAKASMIELDGTLNVFTDIAHGKIYTKQTNLDGTATLNVYSLQQPEVTTGSTVQQSQPQLTETQSLRQELDSIKTMIAQLQSSQGGGSYVGPKQSNGAQSATKVEELF